MQNTLKVIKHRRKKRLKTSTTSPYTTISCEAYVNGKLTQAIEEFKTSQFSLDFLTAIEDCLRLLDQQHLGEVICYGLGNFTENKAALHQLAALLIIIDNYKVPVKVYDPIFSHFEIEVLKNLNFYIFCENEEGKHKIEFNIITLVFLPHCSKQLINNFLWANWNTVLENCILISNSFSEIVVKNTRKVVENSAYYISKILPKTKEIHLNNNYFFENIFNDISIHCFFKLDKEFFLNSLQSEPVYLEDIEFISKKIDTVKIENE